MKNPFSILGLTKDSLQGLSSGQISQLINRQKRSLLAFFHPDSKACPNEERYKEAKEASRVLENPAEFQRWLTALQSRVNKTEVLATALVEASTATVALKQKFTDYLQKAANASLLTVYNAFGYQFNVADTVRQMGQSLTPKKEQGSFSILAVDERGNLSRISGSRKIPLSHRSLFACISYQQTQQQGGINSLLLRVIAPSQADTTGRFISGKQFVHETGGSFHGAIPLGRFWEIVDFTTPMIDKSSYIFTLEESEAGKFVILEGSVIHSHDSIIKPVNG